MSELKRNQEIYFSRNGTEWTVQKTEICDLAGLNQAKARAFYQQNKELIDGYATARSKAQLARDCDEDCDRVLRLLKKAEWFGVLPEKKV